MLTRAGSTRRGLWRRWRWSLLAAGCRKEGLADQAQIGAAVGEVMASADESANGGSTTAMLLPILRARPASCGRRSGAGRWIR